MTIRWPVAEDPLILWAQVLLAWVLCVYVVLGNEPIVGELGRSANDELLKRTKRRIFLKALLLSVAIIMIHTWTGFRTAMLILLLAGLAIALPLLRIRFAARKILLGAELEVGVNLLVVVTTAVIIGNPFAAPLRGLIALPVTGNHLTLIIFVVAILLFLSTAGTHIVRGLLAKVGAFPTKAAEGEIDLKEYNRGRVIGVIERLIMTGLVAVSAYSALMFLMGAKGLMRSKQFENHEFAEYFLIGTLASAAVAIVFGLLLQGLTRYFW